MMETDAKTGLRYRRETSDMFVIREQRSYLPLGLEPDDIVIDLGANIGAFTALQAAHCRQVICIEPEAGNMEMLRLNVKKGPGPGVHGERRLIRAAVVPNMWEGDEVPLYVNSKKNRGLHRLAPTRGRMIQMVPALRFEEMIDLGRAATAMKCDIEGGEHDLPWGDLDQTNIRKLAMEIHLIARGNRERALDTISAIQSAGFRSIHKPPNLHAKRLATLGFWQR